MPFTTTPKLEPNPSVRIFFTGLLILKPIADNACQVFVHNSSIEHNLIIEVRRKRPGKPDVILMRAPGPLSFTGGDPSRTHGLLIRTAGLPAGEKGVKAYDGTNQSSEGTKLSDSFTLSKILDVSPGNVDLVGGLPSIMIDHGVFYTADIVDLKASLIKKSGAKTINFLKVPRIIGANVYLNHQDPAQKVNLTWRQQGKDVSLDLKPSPNFSHEIYINNEPLYEEDSATAPVHDEFEEYFKILPDVDLDEQFNLVFPDPIPDRGSSRTPCMSVLLNE